MTDDLLRKPAYRRRAGAGAAAAVVVLLVLPVAWTIAQVPFGPTQNPLAGAQVFGAKGCVNCHAVRGLGGRVGPDLGRIRARRSFYDLAAAMWNHLPSMSKRMREEGVDPPQLDGRETGDLIAFLFTLDYFDPPGELDMGRRLFIEKKCVVCHQVGGFGGVIGPNLDFLSEYGSPILVASAMWNHGPAMTEAMRERGIERPTFTGAELTDLISYLESASPRPPEGPLYVLPGRADQGRDVFAAKSCVECHSVHGRGGKIGPELADQGRRRSEIELAAAMWNKAPAMTAAMEARGISVPRLTAEEMADLVAYLYSVGYFAESGDRQRGQALIRAKRCLVCHSLGGRGGADAGDLAGIAGLGSPAAVIAALWNHARLMDADPDRLEVSWPAIGPQAMADLAAFLGASQGSR